MANKEGEKAIGRLGQFERPDLRDPFVREIDTFSKEPELVDDFSAHAAAAAKNDKTSPVFKRLLRNGLLWHSMGTRRALEIFGDSEGKKIDVYISQVTKGVKGKKSVSIPAGAPKVEASLVAIIGAKHGHPTGVILHGIAFLNGAERNKANAIVVGIYAENGFAYPHPNSKRRVGGKRPIHKLVPRAR